MIINKFDNAYGIKGLNLKSLSGELNNLCIYASNGIFKSSFSRALFNLAENNSQHIRDRIKDKKFEYEILKDGVNYKTDDGQIIPNLIVYSKELYEDMTVDKQSGFEQLLLLPKDQHELSLVYKEFDNYFDEIIKYAKEFNIGIKNSYDLASLVDLNTENLGVILKSIYNSLLSTKPLELVYLDFKKVDQKAYSIIDSKEFKDEVNKYTSIVQRKINSKLFDEKFNDTNYEKFISALEETEFLNENRYIVLNGEKFDNIFDLKNKISEELKIIKSDSEVVAQYNNVLKTLGTAKESTVVKDLLKDDTKVSELSLGRNVLKLSKIRNKYSDDELLSRLEVVDELQKKIQDIIKLSQGKTSSFEKAIDIYTSRFKPKFEIRVDNLFEARLGYEVPKIDFIHKDNVNRKYNESEIYNLLSSGEKNALKTIHLIVRYEAIKDNKPTIILDDVVETFDYANRIAFLMYLKEIKEKGCNIILLTHNFDFYRAAISRVDLKPSEAYIDKNKHVVIRKNSKFQLSYNKIKNITSCVDLFSSIPFVRELSIMCHGEDNNDDFLFFTKLLHIKKGSKDIKVSEIIERIKNVVPNVKTDKYEYDLNQSFVESLINYNFDQKIENNDLKTKLALSMAIRLILEDKIIDEDYLKIADCTENQTIYLFEKYKNDLNDKTKVIFEKVLLNTPEFIHFNSFMYEPLVDIDPKDLIEVYNEVKETQDVFNSL